MIAIPAHSPSNPSIRFIAFTNPINAKTKNGKAIKLLNTKSTPKNVPKL